MGQSVFSRGTTETMNKVVAIVGMAGSGKSEVARVFEKSAFARIRFGDITDQEIKRRGLELNEENERYVRQELRREHGMAAYAILNLTTISEALVSTNVVVDGLYSWEEYTLLKSRFEDDLCLVAVWASPRTRYQRLAGRKVRPLTGEEAASRDNAEIEKTNKGGPIAMADFTIINEASLKELYGQTKKVLADLK
jgi:dephospho-CoA kinase